MADYGRREQRGVQQLRGITLETRMNPKCGVNQSHEPPFKCVKMEYPNLLTETELK